jgi:glycosyltransferase involved in cell wall biosynthesis
VRGGKIAFIKQGSFSHINGSVARMLAEAFPEYYVEVIDTWNWRSTIAYKMINRLLVFKDFGRLILYRRKSSKDYLTLTPYYLKRLQRAVIEHLRKGDYAFSFQTEALFDASVPGIPHFVYAAHANLVNRQYPAFDRRDLLPPSWIDLERRAFHNATRVFTFSRILSRSIVEEYGCPEEKVISVGAGANAKADLELTDDPARYARKHILFVGVYWTRKGGPTLVEAFKRVLAVHPDARLTIVGCAPSVDVPNCDIVSKVALEETNRYYKEASIFCLPTTVEPFGIAFLEAMSHQLPVIGTTIGAIPEFVQEGRNGFLVRPFDVENLAARLIELIDNPAKCRTMGFNGYELVRQRYNWKQVGASVRDHIERAIELT